MRLGDRIEALFFVIVGLALVKFALAHIASGQYAAYADKF